MKIKIKTNCSNNKFIKTTTEKIVVVSSGFSSLWRRSHHDTFLDLQLICLVAWRVGYEIGKANKNHLWNKCTEYAESIAGNFYFISFGEKEENCWGKVCFFIILFITKENDCQWCLISESFFLIAVINLNSITVITQKQIIQLKFTKIRKFNKTNLITTRAPILIKLFKKILFDIFIFEVLHSVCDPTQKYEISSLTNICLNRN